MIYFPRGFEMKILCEFETNGQTYERFDKTNLCELYFFRNKLFLEFLAVKKKLEEV